jgi:hypothetical protein
MKPTLSMILTAIAVAVFAQEPPNAQQIAAVVHPNDLKADVSFLASDALEGRGPVSKGLDVAAEYIAAQFRRACLEAAGDDDYFQTVPYTIVKPRTEGLKLTLTIGGRKLAPNRSSIIVMRPGPLNVENADAMVAQPARETASVEVTPEGATFSGEQYDGKIVIADLRDELAMNRSQPKLTIFLSATDDTASPAPSSASSLRESSTPAPALRPAVIVTDLVVRSAIQEAKDAPIKVTAHIPGPSEEPAKQRNVVGVLRGSDPILKNTYVVVSAHYDHWGINPRERGDKIFNGANDDASGVAGVIAVAKALSAQQSAPKRSVVFLVVFGEEQGMVGSRYYVRHPIFPMEKTIADINLELIGRTDSTQGPRTLQFNLTGQDYTTLGAYFEQAGQQTGIQLVKDAGNSEHYFYVSDNVSFAAAGVPSTTICVTYAFPDLHGAGDEWAKLDYENMSKVTGTVAAAVFQIANDDEVPHWNSENPRTVPYIKVHKSVLK